MRHRKAITLALGLVSLFGSGTAGSRAAAQAPNFAGSYTYVAEESDNINQAIDVAVAKLNFALRPIGRRRLRNTNQPYPRVVIANTDREVAITLGDRAPIRTPSNGTPIRWKRPEDGEELRVSTEWENGTLEQTFAAEDGKRVNAYTLSPDGRTMTMRVTITSERLKEPVRYRLVYRRAS